MKTQTQKEYPNGIDPAVAPLRISDRNWSITVHHLNHGITYTELARRHGITHVRVRKIVERSIIYMKHPRVSQTMKTPPKPARPLPERIYTAFRWHTPMGTIVVGPEGYGRLTDEQILAVRNIGPKSLAAIRSVYPYTGEDQEAQ